MKHIPNDKLRILAENTKSYVLALIKKEIISAEKSEHLMSAPEYSFNWLGFGCDRYTSTCGCGLIIIVENMSSISSKKGNYKQIFYNFK